MRDAESRFADSPTGAPVGIGVGLLVGLLTALFVALTATPASATVAYPNIASFGTDGSSGTSFGAVSQTAMDQTGNRLYVLNTSPASIYAYDISTPGTFTPAGSPLITGLATPGTNPDIAVDNTGGGTAGRIYYVAQGAGSLSGFSSAGASLGAPFAPLTPPNPKSLCGVAVNSAANIGIGNSNNTARNVLRYSSTGTALTSISTTAQGGGPCRIAFDSNDDLYFALNNGATWRYTAASGYSSASAQQFDATATRAIAVDRVTHRVYVLHANKVNIWSSAGAPIAEFGTGISSNFRGISVDEGTGDIYVSDLTANKVHLFRPVNAPLPTTGATSNLQRNTATVLGHVEPDGAGDVTECKFEYGLTVPYGQSKPCTDALPIAAGEDVSADLTGLTTDTLYHYRLTAANATVNSTNVGADMTFTTPTAVAGVTTKAASDQTQTTAVLNGTFTGDGLETEYWFEWGPTTSYGTVVSAGPDSSAVGPVTATASIEGLSIHLPASQPYHYRLVAENSTGKSIGPDKAFFAAPPDLPEISGTTADELTPTGARLSGSINPGNGPTIYVFEYGPTTSYGSKIPTPVESMSIAEDSTEHLVTEALAGLTPGTVYHFRLSASNFTGTTRSADQTFVTPGIAGVESSSVSAVTQSTAHLSSQVIANGSPTSLNFEYGTTTAYGQSTEPKPIGAEIFLVESGADLNGLSPGTTYHFRAVATNGVGTAQGSDQTFTTLAAPNAGPIDKVKRCKKPKVRRNGKCVKKKKKIRRGSRRNG